MDTASLDAFREVVYETMAAHNIQPRILIYCCLLGPKALKTADGTEIEFYATIPGGYNATLWARPLGTTQWIKIYRIRPSNPNLNLASIVEQNGYGEDCCSECSGGETED
jgi:hypothetical protein